MEATPSGAGPAPTAVATATATVKAAAAGPLNAAALGPSGDLLAASRTTL
jgi:hypothetical protein